MGNNKLNCNIKDTKMKEEVGKKAAGGLKYVPKSGADFKISSNFDLNFQTDKGIDPEIILSRNKFDALKDLDDEQHQNVLGAVPINSNSSFPLGVLQDLDKEDNMEALYAEFGLDKSAYESYMNQEEVTDGISGLDTNMESV